MANGTTNGQGVTYVGSDFQVNIATILLPVGYTALTLPAVVLAGLGSGVVTVGPPDSGGMGFRILVVPN